MSYYSDRTNRSIEDFDRQRAKQEFEKVHRAEIEQGMTREQFSTKYAATQDDLQLFDDLKAVITEESEQGELFLKGFASVRQSW